VDAAGNAYVTGFTTSSNFPDDHGGRRHDVQRLLRRLRDQARPRGLDAPLLHLSRGSGVDLGSGIAVDPAGNAYVTGFTDSTDFPTTLGAFDTTCGTVGFCNGGFPDAFVVKIAEGGARRRSSSRRRRPRPVGDDHTGDGDGH